MLADEIEQREKVDPDKIDQVPVQADQIDRRVVSAAELTAIGLYQQPDHGRHAAKNVDSVQPGHHEVEAEEDVLVGDGVPFVRIEVAGEQTLFELVRVFEILHTKEDAGAGERHQDEQLQLCLLIGFSGMQSHHHGVDDQQKDDGDQKP